MYFQASNLNGKWGMEWGQEEGLLIDLSLTWEQKLSYPFAKEMTFKCKN